MKALLAILVIIIAILAFVLTRPVKKGGMYKNSPKTTTEQQQEISASQPQPPPQEKPSKAGQIAEEVNSVINYGTGATAIKAKKNISQKLQGIQQKQNADQARELGK